MAKAIAIFEGGIHERRQYAVRDDGAVFKRFQQRGRYGYQWTAWKATGETMGHNEALGRTTLESGFSTLYRASPNSANVNLAALFNDRGEIRARLP